MKISSMKWLISHQLGLKQPPLAGEAPPSETRPVQQAGVAAAPESCSAPDSRAHIRLAIIGNCQALALARCINAIADGVAATGTEICRMASNPEEIDLAPVLADNDILLAHPNHLLQQAINARYAQERNRIRTIPTIAFPAYHPDLVYIAHSSGKRFSEGPLNDYNSSLALYGWRKGMGTAQVLELFNEEVYGKLGFFEYWESSRDTFLKNAAVFDYSLEESFSAWTRRGCFMHSINHPKYFTLADLARMALKRLGIGIWPIGEEFIYDHFVDGPVWPVYPEIGRRLGIEGHYLFKQRKVAQFPEKPVRMLDLEEFVRQSLEAFSRYDRKDLVCDRLDSAPYQELDKLVGTRSSAKAFSAPRQQEAAREPKRQTPYDGLPGFHFWRKAVSGIPFREVDPVVAAGFKIDRQTKVATAGSCFAQHISRKLQQQGFNYYIAEKPPELSAGEASRLNYGVFSARYGNIYTARQLLQLYDRAFGTFHPFDSAWLRTDGRYADPFRPRVEPDGFATAEEVESSQTTHLAAVRDMFQKMDVLVFTLGLTEAWRAKKDGAVFPLAPGVSAGRMDSSLYEFVNFSANEVQADLEGFVEKLSRVNGNAKIIFTVSPVPLIATFENRHVLVSTTYSKSVLRVAAEEMVRKYSNCFYFPAYEIITGNYNRGSYYEDDLRSVNENGVDHAMRLFFAHYAGKTEKSVLYETLAHEAERVKDIICDEEEIDAA